MRLVLILKILSGVLYFAALIAPTFDGADYIGLLALMLGWMGLLGDPYVGIPWLANILFFIAWFFWRKPKIQTVLLILALGSALLVFGLTEVLINEGGTKAKVQPGLGTYLWLSSLLLFLLAALWKTIKQHRHAT